MDLHGFDEDDWNFLLSIKGKSLKEIEKEQELLKLEKSEVSDKFKKEEEDV